MKRSGIKRKAWPNNKPRKPLARVSKKKASKPVLSSAGRVAASTLKKENAERRRKRKAKYAAFMMSAAWKKIRAAAIARANGKCESCGWDDNLTVHHKTYRRFGGQELPEDLEVLCRTCHERVHALEGKKVTLTRR